MARRPSPGSGSIGSGAAGGSYRDSLDFPRCVWEFRRTRSRFARYFSVERRRPSMPATDPRNRARRRVTRREFLERAGLTGAGAAALAAGIPNRRAAAQQAGAYPEWIPASTKPAKRGGMLTRAAAWDPPLIDPRP